MKLQFWAFYVVLFSSIVLVSCSPEKSKYNPQGLISQTSDSIEGCGGTIENRQRDTSESRICWEIYDYLSEEYGEIPTNVRFSYGEGRPLERLVMEGGFDCAQETEIMCYGYSLVECPKSLDSCNNNNLYKYIQVGEHKLYEFWKRDDVFDVEFQVRLVIADEQGEELIKDTSLYYGQEPPACLDSGVECLVGAGE